MYRHNVDNCHFQLFGEHDARKDEIIQNKLVTLNIVIVSFEAIHRDLEYQKTAKQIQEKLGSAMLDVECFYKLDFYLKKN